MITTNNNNNNHNNNNNNNNDILSSLEPKKDIKKNKKRYNNKIKNNNTDSYNNQSLNNCIDNNNDDDIDSISKLPEEIIVKILNYLNESDILNLSLVSNILYKITQYNEIWLSVYKKTSFHCELLKQNYGEFDFKSIIKSKNLAKSNWRNGKFKTTIINNAHSEVPTSIKFTGKHIISASADFTLKVWDYFTNECLHTFKNKGTVNVMELDNSNKKVVGGTLNGFINIFNLKTNEIEASHKGHYSYISCLKANYNSTLFCTGSKDKDIKLWSINNNQYYTDDNQKENEEMSPLKMKSHLGSHNKPITNVIWCNINNNHLVSSGDNLVKIWDVETGQCLSSLQGSSPTINPTCLSVKDGFIASCGQGDTISIWDKRVDTPIKNIKTEGNPIYSLQYEPSLCSLATGSFDNQVRCYSTNTSTLISTFNEHQAPISSIYYDPDKVISFGLDGKINIWNYSLDFSNNNSYNNNSNNNNNNNNNKSLKITNPNQSMIRTSFIDETKIITGSYNNSITIYDFCRPPIQKKGDSKFCNIM